MGNGRVLENLLLHHMIVNTGCPTFLAWSTNICLTVNQARGPKKGCRGSLRDPPPEVPWFFQNFPEFSHSRHLGGGRGGVIRSHTRKVGHCFHLHEEYRESWRTDLLRLRVKRRSYIDLSSPYLRLLSTFFYSSLLIMEKVTFSLYVGNL